MIRRMTKGYDCASQIDGLLILPRRNAADYDASCLRLAPIEKTLVYAANTEILVNICKLRVPNYSKKW